MDITKQFLVAFTWQNKFFCDTSPTLSEIPNNFPDRQASKTWPLPGCFPAFQVTPLYADLCSCFCWLSEGRGWLISQPPPAEAFSRPSAQPVSTQRCVRVYRHKAEVSAYACAYACVVSSLCPVYFSSVGHTAPLGQQHRFIPSLPTHTGRESEDQWSLVFQTFVAVTNGVEVNVIVVTVEEHKRKPRVKRVDGNHEENTDDPTLLAWTCIVAQMLIYLQ